MRSLRILNRRAGSLVAAFALFFAFVIPTIAAAATVSERSIELSNSTISSTGVTYRVNFTSVGAAGAFVVDFCSNTPLIGEACTAPTGMNAAAAAATGGFTVASATANKVVVTGTIAATTAISVPLTGITNTSTVGPIYARIVTFTDGTGAGAYTSATPGTHIDDGGVALSITNKIAVSAAVLENMTFCVSAAVPTANCGGVTAPTLKLGEGTGDVLALSSTAISTGNIYSQLSTNAAGGAIVSMKSSNDCGGLKRVGTAACDIPAALAAGITAGTPGFGVKTNTPAGVGTNSGSLLPIGNYNTTTYALNYLNGGASGVTSTYGDPVFNSNSLPVSNMNIGLTFGATISNQTPAGLYSADLSLIATGKF